MNDIPDDSDVADILPLLKKLRLKVFIIGPDDAPLVIFKDKFTGKSVGGLELRKRIKQMEAKEE